MKKLIVAVYLVLGFTTFAQVEKMKTINKEPIEKKSPDEKSKRVLKRMTKELGLNELQQKQMDEILSESVVNKDLGSKALKKERELINNKIIKILNPQQNATWEKIQVERKEKNQARKKLLKEKVEKSEAE